jgi:CubicO group peptidase (beta-lactamase class C family)
MKRIAVLALFIVVVIHPSRTHAGHAQADEIASLMTAAHKVGVLNGTVLVNYKGKLFYQASLGYADSTRTRELSNESRFYIGSIDKEFSGAGLLLLEQQGKLKLADKVSQYLADYPWANAVQVGQLINYTSGLPELPDLPYGGIHDWLMKLPALAVKPGLAYIYSYADVYLQQKIIEKITGLDYRQFVISRLLRPCGISDVQADTALNDPRTALPFSNSFKPVDLTSSMSPGMMFTAFDLFHWMDCLSTNQLLNASSLEVIGTSFGGGESNLGSAAVENGRLSRHQHQGSGYNYEALVFSDAEEPVIIVLLTNNQNFKLFQLKDAILAILHGQPYAVPKKSIYLDIREGLASDFNQGMNNYLQLRQTGKDIYDFSSEPLDLISAGKYLMRRQKLGEAMAIFELSTTFPLSPSDRSYAYELIADCWLEKGNHGMTVFYYERALETDSTNKNAKGKLDGMKEGGQ